MKTYGLNDRHPDIQRLQRCMNEVLGLDMKPDGVFGKMTQSALQDYQSRYKIKETNRLGVCYGPVTQKQALPFIERKYLNENHYVEAAKKLNLEVNIIKTVTAVEALQFGFYNNGTPVTLFERHVFYRELVASRGSAYATKITAMYPDICNTQTGGYIGGKAELTRLAKARGIDEAAALKSASYGLFQIMGFNYLQTGNVSVGKYFDNISIGEPQQLDAFVNYLLLDKDGSLINNLRKKDFASFAREYNGPGYKKNQYDTKMMAEYLRLSKIS